MLPEQLEGTQATFSCWLVAEGDVVTKGQPIAELETDKVAMEICAEASGTIQTLIAKQGEEIEPEQLLGKIAKGTKDLTKEPAMGKIRNKPDFTKSNQAPDQQLTSGLDNISKEKSSAKMLVSPVVRRLLKENNLTIDLIDGTGKKGRVTRGDIQKLLRNAPVKKLIKSKLGAQPKLQNVQTISPSPFDGSLPAPRPLASEIIPHSNMRKSIAKHMVSSLLEISPHVTSVFEMDMSNIIEHRKWHKKEYLEHQVKLTFTAYFLTAMAKAVAKVPQVNARFHKDALEVFSDINVGVGTALGDKGLVVPVVQQVQLMNLFQIAKALSIQTNKARANQLKPSDMKNGTLTISNHGVSGSLFATPIIINQPQVAILGVGKLEKRVVVENVDGVDEIVIRPKCYVSLSIDHRALDAHQTNLFLSEFVRVIESWGV